MTDYSDLTRRLDALDDEVSQWAEWHSYDLPAIEEAAAAIRELVEERDEYKGKWDAVSDRCNSALFDLKYARKAVEGQIRHVEKAEADLAAARDAYKELHDFFDVEGCDQISDLYRQHCIKHATAIAAARAEGGE